MKDEKESIYADKFVIENVYDQKQPKNVCHLCDQKFFDASSKKKHLKNMHEVETHYLCDNCHKSFSSFNDLQKHKKEHVKKVDDKKEKCDFCDKKIAKKRMTSHIREHLDMYKCNECDISFTRVELNKHISSVHCL